MPNLQNLLTILDGQKLVAGYLTPSGTGTALETVIAMKAQFARDVLLQNPLPGMTNVPVGPSGAPQPNFLLSPAWVASLAAGQDAIYLDGVDGNLDFSPHQPAFIFSAT